MHNLARLDHDRLHQHQTLWPAIPHALEQLCLDHCQPGGDLYTEFLRANPWAIEALAIDPVDHQDPPFTQWEAPQEFVQWAHSNLPLAWDQHLWRTRVQRFRARDSSPVHKDILRDYSYNYLLKPSSALTLWHDDQGQTIDHICYPQGQWYRHEGSVAHSVINILEPRWAVTVYIDIEPTPDALWRTMQSIYS